MIKYLDGTCILAYAATPYLVCTVWYKNTGWDETLSRQLCLKLEFEVLLY
jgi:hypothetical protein